MPTLRLTGDIIHSKSSPPLQTKATTRNIGVTLTLPVWNGGALSSRARQTVHEYQVASHVTKEQSREIASTTRQSYRSILTKISQVKALKQAVISSDSALEATQAAFAVGTRTIVDVLNAQSDLLNAKRNYSNARYDYIIESLKLKQAAGTLGETDVHALNNWLHNSKANTAQLSSSYHYGQ